MIGSSIVAIRKATVAEQAKLGLESTRHHPLIVIVLSTGTVIAASQDEEGNGPGAFFTLEPDGTSHILDPR